MAVYKPRWLCELPNVGGLPLFVNPRKLMVVAPWYLAQETQTVLIFSDKRWQLLAMNANDALPLIDAAFERTQQDPSYRR